MNQSYRQGVSIIIILLVLIGLGALTSRLAERNPVAGTSTTTQTATVEPIQYNGEDGKSVLELLKKDHQVEVRESSFGTYVTSVDGVAQTENSFWLYYIDGTPASEAADKAMTKNGQTIEWRYESF